MPTTSCNSSRPTPPAACTAMPCGVAPLGQCLARGLPRLPRKDELDAAGETIGSATAVPGDIADPDRLYDAVRRRGRGRGLDTPFANAGTAGFATLETTTEEHVRHQRCAARCSRVRKRCRC